MSEEEAKKSVHSILSHLVSDFTRCAGEVSFDWLETTHLHYPQISSRLAKWRPLFVRRLEILTGFLILFALLFALIMVERMFQSGVFITPRYPFMILTNYIIKSEFKWNCFMSSQLTDFGSQLIAVKTENKLLVNAFTSLTKFLHRNTQS